MEKKISISDQELKDLKLVRNYFGENDQTIDQHFCYDVLNNLFKKLNGNTEKREKKTFCDHDKPLLKMGDNEYCYLCSLPLPKE